MSWFYLDVIYYLWRRLFLNFFNAEIDDSVRLLHLSFLVSNCHWAVVNSNGLTSKGSRDWNLSQGHLTAERHNRILSGDLTGLLLGINLIVERRIYRLDLRPFQAPRLSYQIHLLTSLVHQVELNPFFRKSFNIHSLFTLWHYLLAFHSVKSLWKRIRVHNVLVVFLRLWFFEFFQINKFAFLE